MMLLLAGLAHALDHHVLQEGETLADVAEAEGVSVAALRSLNQIEPRQTPAIGTVLLIPGDDVDTPAAVVLTVSGPATATLPGAAAVRLVQTRVLPSGTLVCTEPDGYATLRLATATSSRDHDEVTLLGGTCLTLDASWSHATDHASVVSVRRGSVAVRAGAGGKGAVTVRTDAGVTTSDAGGFRVTVEEGAARTEALDGPVAVLGAGKRVDLATGFGTRVRKGEAPAAASTLLAPGVPEYPSEKSPMRRPDFAWSPVDRALGYRLEIATTADFSEIVLAEDVGAPPWEPDSLFLPFRGVGLWWRIASFDRTGFLGPPSSPQRIVLPAGVGL
ncbi:MAG: LysM peptidoglycan-binding domain-containing protein [Pseudomonadota bacterium]|nr:LysM peptidoglycan-binding domain-containing protein [Pseudomonadota bacterium]